MKLIPALALALMATAVNAAPFPAATDAQANSRLTVRYYLFVLYYPQTNVTSAIQLGPFRTESACANAASLLATKIAVGASACLKNQ